MLWFMNKRTLLVLVFFVTLLKGTFAMDIWRYPELADKGSIFTGGLAAEFRYSFANPRDFEFTLDYPEVYLDYVLPVGLPFSLGASVKPLRPGLLGLGIRAGYHINFNVPALDAYALYAVTVDLTEETGLLEYGAHIGFRWRLLSIICINIETGYMFRSIKFGVAIKLH